MNRLPMQDDEIANSYRLAKDPEAQVIAQGSEVTLHSVETDENGGVMIAVVDGLMVYAEVPIR